VKPSNDSPPTRFLYVAGVGEDMGTDVQLLIDVFSRFGPLEAPCIEMIKGKRYCFVIYHEVNDAIKAKEELGDQPNELLGVNKIMIKYAKEYEFCPCPESEPSIRHNEGKGMYLYPTQFTYLYIYYICIWHNNEQQQIFLDYSLSKTF